MLTRIEKATVRLITAIAHLASWLFIVLVVVILVDVFTRRMRMAGGTMYQELEWHIHTVIFSAGLGYAYLHNAHVRVDSFMHRFSARTRALIEVIGFFILLLPFAFVVLWEGVDFAREAYGLGEVSDSPGGLTHRWIIKSVLPISMLLLILAGLVVVHRSISFIFGRRAEGPFE